VGTEPEYLRSHDGVVPGLPLQSRLAGDYDSTDSIITFWKGITARWTIAGSTQ
jgi:hypothetical protein